MRTAIEPDLTVGVVPYTCPRPPQLDLASAEARAGIAAGVAMRIGLDDGIWIGEVIDRSNKTISLQLWGSGVVKQIGLGEIRLVDVVPRHSFRYYSDACRNQRQGRPADASLRNHKPSAVIELDGDVLRLVKLYATQQKLPFKRAVARLIMIGFQRTAALQKWNAKERASLPVQS